jgi:YidC/Oxa1 family membrane protein insertase
VSIPLMILASILTHLTARHSVARQNPESATAQTAIMNKVTLYLFPLGVLLFGFFFPIGLLLYWLANNSWTLMQQRVVYRRIDREEAEKKVAAAEKRAALGPKPGQKPTIQVRKRPTAATTGGTDATTAATTKPASPTKPATTAKPGGTPAAKRTANAGGNGATASAAKPSGNGSTSAAKPATRRPAAAKPSGDGTEIPGLITDRSRSKKSGRKNR